MKSFSLFSIIWFPTEKKAKQAGHFEAALPSRTETIYIFLFWKSKPEQWSLFLYLIGLLVLFFLSLWLAVVVGSTFSNTFLCACTKRSGSPEFWDACWMAVDKDCSFGKEKNEKDFEKMPRNSLRSLSFCLLVRSNRCSLILSKVFDFVQENETEAISWNQFNILQDLQIWMDGEIVNYLGYQTWAAGRD